MSVLLQITLGILTALGGFIDIGELVFSVQAGARFQFQLLWAVVVGTLGIITFAEMSGRVAAVSDKPVFELMDDLYPRRFCLLLLVATTLLNALTFAAELGGVAITLQLLTTLSHVPALLLAVGAFAVIVWALPFKVLEKVFGLLGLAMVVFLVANLKTGVNLHEFGLGLVPRLPDGGKQSALTYAYFAVGIVSSSMMPYEVYFYSSGAIEEHWTPKKLLDNKLTVLVGMGLGGVLSGSLIMLGGKILGPRGITPELHGTSALLVAVPMGKIALVVALFGIVFAVAGAAVETCLAGAYNIAQYFKWTWGRYRRPETTPAFTATWLAIVVVGFFILLLGLDPVALVEYAVIFSLVPLPFTYYAILRAAGDPEAMGEYTNKRLATVFGWAYLLVVTVTALAAVPLMVLTNQGNS